MGFEPITIYHESHPITTGPSLPEIHFENVPYHLEASLLYNPQLLEGWLDSRSYEERYNLK